MAAFIGFIASLLVGAPAASSCTSLPTTTDAHEHIAVLFNYDKPEESAAALLALADTAIRCGNRELAAQALAQAARAQGVGGRSAEANFTLERAARTATIPVTRTKITLEQGRLARRAGDKAKAKALLTEAFNGAMDLRADALAADAAHMLALATEGTESEQWTHRGLAIAEASEDQAARRWLGNLAFNAGIIAEEKGDHKLAALMFARSLSSRQRQDDPELIGTTELALSVELAHLGMFEEAEAIQGRLLREHKTREAFVVQVKQELDRIASLREKAGH